ncbi:MAG: pyridoxamine 5'-phosphate oxidase family protein [Nitrospirota bacterium]|nr:MAG: pyridoxamine 5'-phosphate oxidase family protein [Nitrospirota bacterium]
MYRGSSAEQFVQHKLGTTKRAQAFYQKQWVNQLTEDMQVFIQGQEMVFIGTADEHGSSDCSLRVGETGFVHVLDSRRLAYPEYRGNGVMASVGNMLTNPNIGMLFVDFFQGRVGLHVNGKAQVLENHELAQLPDVPQIMLGAGKANGGPQSVCWVLIEIEEAYIHCSKHIPLLAKLDKQLH